MYEVRTSGSNTDEDTMLIPQSDQYHADFRVTECGSKYTMIFQNPSDVNAASSLTLEFTVNEDAAEIIVLRNCSEDLPTCVLAMAVVRGVAICNNPQDMWVSWHSNRFRFGLGKVYSDTKLQASVPNLLVSSLRLTSSEHTTWQFYQDQCEYLFFLKLCLCM